MFKNEEKIQTQQNHEQKTRLQNQYGKPSTNEIKSYIFISVKKRI